jgi:uncharacterized protein (TIGR00661 family)
MLLSSGDALHALSPPYRVYQLPNLRYEYNAVGQRCLFRTARVHWPTISDSVFGGPALDGVVRALREFAPDVAICDADPFIHHAAARLGIPRISFDHFGILAFCRIAMPAADRVRAMRDCAAYRMLIGNPERIVVSSFFEAPATRTGVTLVPALVRQEVRNVRPTPGEHLLVYLNNGRWQMTPNVEEALRALRMPVVVYGTDRRGDDGYLSFRAPAQQGFIDDLARAIAVFGTAGNQLVAEALHLGKPMLVAPENTVEQRTNARAIESMGFGRAVAHSHVTARVIQSFLSEVPERRSTARRFARDGTDEAATALLRFAAELSARRRAPTRLGTVSVA